MRITYGFSPYNPIGGKEAHLHIDGKKVWLGFVIDKKDAEDRAKEYLKENGIK